MSFTCCIRGASCATCEETTGGWCASEATACGACGGIPDGLCAVAAESPPEQVVRRRRAVVELEVVVLVRRRAAAVEAVEEVELDVGGGRGEED